MLTNEHVKRWHDYSDTVCPLTAVATNTMIIDKAGKGHYQIFFLHVHSQNGIVVFPKISVPV